MIDVTSPTEGPHSPEASGRSFRSRLLLAVGPALAAALLVLGVLGWMGVYAALQRGAVDVLRTEAEEVEADLLVDDGSFHVGGHTWSEVHHRLAARRVDPVFLQVFDRHNRLLRASANVDSLSALYPEQPLALSTPYAWLPTLRTFEAGGRSLYYLVRPIVRDGATVGYIQVARGVPNFRPLLTTVGVGLGAVILVLFGGLLALVSWAAGRVLRPLREITAFAEGMTPSDLDERIHLPAEADRETRLLARTVNDLLDRLAESFSALRTFTANAAHELQTPLTVLQGHVDIALRKPRSAESYASTLRLLNRKLGHLIRTVRSLLMLTRLDRGETLSTERVSLRELVSNEVEVLRPRIEEKGLSLVLEIDDLWVDGQPDLLGEAIHNLLDNAVKYTQEGTITLTVTEDDGSAVIRCADTGIGIADEDLASVGDRFYRSSGATTTEVEGSGLGLSLVRRIADAHGGELRVESTDGEGSRFDLCLGAVPAPERPSATPSL